MASKQIMIYIKQNIKNIINKRNMKIRIKKNLMKFLILQNFSQAKTSTIFKIKTFSNKINIIKIESILRMFQTFCNMINAIKIELIL